MIRPRTTAAKVAILGALYFAEGLPFGFQAKALPLYLRERGVSLETIGLTGLLAMPWWLKWTWAPLVDRYGRRKSWILPTQALLALSAALASVFPVERGLELLFTLVFLQNLLAATQDVAIDGLAVDILAGGELGAGNAAQVAGYKVGMLTSGGVLVWLSGELGLTWAAVFGGAGLLTTLVLVVTFVLDEPKRSVSVRTSGSDPVGVVTLLFRSVRAPGGAWLLTLVFGYKLGETLVDTMFKPWLKDLGYPSSRIAFWINSLGTVVSIGGSVFGGFLAVRLRLLTALRVSAGLRILPLAALAALTFMSPSWSGIVAVAWTEEFFGGALTTVLFALMMSRVDPRIGATHFTALATLELAGKALAGLPSGVLAAWLEYGGVFLLGTALSVVYLGLALRARLPHESPGAADPPASALASTG